MLTLQIWNVSDLAPVSDYKYALYINRDQIAGGEVKAHKRSDGWPTLVMRIASAHETQAIRPALEDALAALSVMYDDRACGLIRERDGAICVRKAHTGKKHTFVKVRPA